MRRLAGPFAIAVVLLAIITWQMADAPRADVAPPPQRPDAGAAATPVQDTDHTHDWVATVLARPLFSVDRRPASVVAAVAGAALPGLPRLTGIMVGPFGRNAIFAVDGQKPLVVQEGARVAAYTVKSIEAAQVHLLGPEGMRVLNPSFQSGPEKTANATLVPQRFGQAPAPR